jgi:hypothetical protein
MRTDHLGIRMIAKELNMDKETVRQILTTNFSMKKEFVKMLPKNLPVPNLETNTNAGICSVLTRSYPV